MRRPEPVCTWSWTGPHSTGADHLTAPLADHLTAPLADHLTAPLADHLTSSLADHLTSPLADHLTLAGTYPHSTLTWARPHSPWAHQLAAPRANQTGTNQRTS